MPEENSKGSLAIPIAVLAAGAIIAGAFFYSRATPGTSAVDAAPAPQVMGKEVPGVAKTDHLSGDIGAPVKIVEYTDLDCPYCKQFDGTMRQLIAAYPGKVAWVIRNFPIVQLHPNALQLALAAECVSALGGNDAYWKFKDALLAAAPITEDNGVITNAVSFDMAKLTPTATALGIDGKTFDMCVGSATYAKRVKDDFDAAVAAGAKGAPFSVLITKDGTEVPIPGSQPYDQLKAAVDAALKN